jgi:myo-inositol-1(or 4)-monophosphatase
MTTIKPQQLQEFLQIATDAAIAGGEILRKHWGKLKSVEEKSSSSDLVTIADRESEKCIIDILHQHFPYHGFLGEESGTHFGHDPDFIWVIDPLDGTTNYTHKFPMVSVSIGLVYRNEPIVGVVYNPILNDFFHAAKGCGAFHNKKPIKISKVSELKKSLLVTGFAYNRNDIEDNNYVQFVRMTQISHGVRRLGSAALDLAFVASGSIDGYWEKGLKPWDMAAGAVLVTEAGGRVSACDLSGFDLYTSDMLATNGLIHDLLSKELS